MKKIILILPLIVLNLVVFACPACEKQQPKIFRGAIHGAGPDSNWDYLITAGATVIVLATLFFAVKWIIKPGENNNNHIKRTVLNW